MSDNEKQITWGGRFTRKPDDLMQVFGESISFDRRLAPYDLQGSLGHASKLASILLENMEKSESPVYGAGYRMMKQKLAQAGWPALLNELKKKSSPP